MGEYKIPGVYTEEVDISSIWMPVYKNKIRKNRIKQIFDLKSESIEELVIPLSSLLLKSGTYSVVLSIPKMIDYDFEKMFGEKNK
jgi:hypothetical protein